MRIKYRYRCDGGFPLVLGICPDDGEELAHYLEGAAHCPRCKEWFCETNAFLPEVQVYLSSGV